MKRLIIVSILTFSFQFCIAQEYTIEVKNINSLYAGINNVLEVSIPNIDSESIILQVTEGKLIKKNDEYIYKNNNTGSFYLKIGYKLNNDIITIDSVKYNVIELPNAVATIDGRNHLRVTKEDFFKTEKIDITFPGLLYELNYKIVSHNIETYIPDGRGYVFHNPIFNNSENIFGRNILLLKKISPGASLNFENIKVLIEGSDSLIVRAKPITVRIIGPKATVQIYDKKLKRSFFYYYSSCGISKRDLIKVDSLDVDADEDYRIDDIDHEDRLDTSYYITSYYVYNRFGKNISVNSNKITKRVKSVIRKTKKGDFIRFYGIKGKNKEGEIVEIGNLALMIKD